MWTMWLLAGSGSRPPVEIPVAAAPAGWLSQHQNRWSVLTGARVKTDQRLHWTDIEPQSLPRPSHRAPKEARLARIVRSQRTSRPWG